MYSFLKERLEERILENNPVRIAVVGAGFMGRSVFYQLNHTNGIRLVAFASRRMSSIEEILSEAQGILYTVCKSAEDVHKALKSQAIPCFEDIALIPYSNPELIIDLTRNIECGIQLAQIAIDYGIHFMAGAEFDAVLGPLYAQKAKEKSLVYTNISGDEPGCIMDLYHYADLAGFHVVALGKFKGFINPYSTPESVLPWVTPYSNPWLISSAADGTKMSIEMAIVANATGFVPDIKGMHCPKVSLSDVAKILSIEKDGGNLSQERVVEVVSGAEPSGGVFAVVSGPTRFFETDLKINKMGDGPNYLLYTPYHMPSIEILFSILRAVLLKNPTIMPCGDPVADVIVHAKRDLQEGEILDEIGGYTYYGVIQKAKIARQEKALNLGLAKGARVNRALLKDEPIFMQDVTLDESTSIYEHLDYFTKISNNLNTEE